jgi:hypothetical protein
VGCEFPWIFSSQFGAGELCDAKATQPAVATHGIRKWKFWKGVMCRSAIKEIRLKTKFRRVKTFQAESDEF